MEVFSRFFILLIQMINRFKSMVLFFTVSLITPAALMAAALVNLNGPFDLNSTGVFVGATQQTSLTGSVTKSKYEAYTFNLTETGLVYVSFNAGTDADVVLAADRTTLPTLPTSTTYGFEVYINGDTLYVLVGADTSATAVPFDLNVTLVPETIPRISISPETKNIKLGTPTVDLNVNITRCPYENDITVTFINDANFSDTGTVQFNTECNTTETITVNVPTNLTTPGDTFDVNLSSVQCDNSECYIDPSVATLTLLSTISDMTVVKDAPKIKQVSTDINYTIDVTNQGAEAATDVVVWDIVSSSVTYIGYTAPAGWNCSYVTADRNLSCAYTGDFASGATDTITIEVTGPSTHTYVTNSAYVESSNDGDILNNISSIATEFVDTATADDLCYYDSGFDDQGSQNCTAIDSFYLGSNCTSFVSVGNQNPLKVVYYVNVKKVYTPPTTLGTCDSNADCGPFSDGTSNGYEYNATILNPFRSILATDIDTDASGVSSVSLYGSYMRDGLVFNGEIPPCSASYPSDSGAVTFGKVDVLDNFDEATYDNGAASVITTKVTEKPLAVDIVYLGENPDGAPEDFDGTPFAMILELAEIDPATGLYSKLSPLKYPDGTLVTAQIDKTSKNVVATSSTGSFTIPKASRDAKIAARYNILSSTLSAQEEQCILRASKNGNLAEISACFNSESRLEEVFINTADTCLNIWTASNGQPYGPCSSNAGNSGFPYIAPFDSEPACLSCLVGPEIQALSKDNFAVRPDRYDISSSEISYPDLLRAGKDYNITIVAYDYIDENTSSYDQSIANLDDNVTKYGSDGVIHNTLAGSTTGNLSGGGNFVNGVTVTPAVYNYNEVGHITIDLVDANWSEVDFDDTPMTCNPDGAYVCGNVDVMFIPDHFKVIVDLNNSSNGFTYLSNDANMTPHMHVQIWAENENNATTVNFTDVPLFGYEHNVTVLMTVPTPAGLPTIEHEISTAKLIGFTDGYRDLNWNESNETLAFWFNYIRQTNKPVNPFRVFGSDVIVDVNSNYTGTAPEGTANIAGTDSDDENLTFVYGRSHMPRTRAMCTGAPCAGNVTFFYEFYGDKGAADYNQTLITDLLGTSPKRSVDSVNWYRNTLHNTATDGNVTFSTQNIPDGGITPVFTHSTQTTSASYSYDGSKGFPYKGTVTVPSSLTAGTQSWLIYDKYKPDPATEIRGELEYYGPGSWSSDTGAAESVKDSSGKKNRNTNRRIRW